MHLAVPTLSQTLTSPDLILKVDHKTALKAEHVASMEEKMDALNALMKKIVEQFEVEKVN